VQLLLDHFRATLKYSRLEINRLKGLPKQGSAKPAPSRKKPAPDKAPRAQRMAR
jgi:hypothetical protein